MAEAGMVTVFMGGYDDIGAAMRDFERIKQLHEDKAIGEYEAALVKKEPSGDVIVAETTVSKRRSRAGVGAAVGGVIGVIFPPSIIGSSIVGSLAGAATGARHKPLRRSDIKQLGELLMEGRSGVVVVTDAVAEAGHAKLLSEALDRGHVTVEADADAIKAAINDAVTLQHAGHV